MPAAHAAPGAAGAGTVPGGGGCSSRRDPLWPGTDHRGHGRSGVGATDARRDPRSGGASASPSAPIDGLRPDINAILEIDGRLWKARRTCARSWPRRTRAGPTWRSCCAASRRPCCPPWSGWVASLVTHRGAWSARRWKSVRRCQRDRRQGLDWRSERPCPYRQLAEDIVDLFTDLPAIDEQLRHSSNPPPVRRPAVSRAPSRAPSRARMRARRRDHPKAPLPSRRPAHPRRLRYRRRLRRSRPARPRSKSCATPASSWASAHRSCAGGVPSIPVTVGAAAPLVPTGSRSLKVHLPAVRSAADAEHDSGSSLVRAVSMRSRANPSG